MASFVRFLLVLRALWGVVILVVGGAAVYNMYGHHQYFESPRRAIGRVWSSLTEGSTPLADIETHAPSPTGTLPAGASANAPASASGGSGAPAPRPAGGNPNGPSSSRSVLTFRTGSGAESDSGCRTSDGRVVKFPSFARLMDSNERPRALEELQARLRCDYDQGSARERASQDSDFEQWRQSTLQKRYGPAWNRVESPNAGPR
jgi:hypothetical protein